MAFLSERFTRLAAFKLRNTVVNAVTVLTGFDVKFSPVDGDHHLGRLYVNVSIAAGETVGQSVEACITYGLRDWSGNWDDRYDGQIYFVVLGE